MPFPIQSYMSQSQTCNHVRYEGTLSKWTNYASGYKRRWFVLENGILSYYKAQSEYPVSCRGSINLKRARIIADPNDKYHFDIVGIDSSIRYHLRADQVSDVKKWVVSLLQAKHSMASHPVRSFDAQAFDDGSNKHSVQTTADTSFAKRVPSASYHHQFGDRGPSLRGQIDESSSYSSIEIATTLPPSPSPLKANDTDKIPEVSFCTEELASSANFSKYLESMVEQMVENEVQLNILAANIDATSNNTLLISQSKQYCVNSKTLFTTLRSMIAASKERERLWSTKLEQEAHSRALLEESMRTLTLAAEADDEEREYEDSKQPQLLFTTVPSDVEDQDSDDEFFDTLNHVNKIPMPASGARHDSPLENSDQSSSDMIADSSTSTLAALCPMRQPEPPSSLPVGTHKLCSSVMFATEDAPFQSATPNIVFTPATPSNAAEYLEKKLVQSTVSLPSDLDLITSSLVGYPLAFRRSLPCPMAVDAASVSIWTILKSAIGKDLTRITIPIHFNEPLSMLQRMSEDMEYSHLLDRASEAPSRLERLMFVAAFAVSNYSSTENRVSKPFNPLLGETFELVSRENGYRYVSEQVSHHPPMSACFCESKNYLYWSEINVKTHFWGKSFEVVPEGICHVRLQTSGEHYSWTKVHTIVNNIIMGKPWIDHYGTMTIKNHATGDYCSIDFKATNWRGNNAKKLEGQVFDSEGTHCFDIVGHWNDSLRAVRKAPGPYAPEILLWKVRPRPLCSTQMYNFTAFSMCLNELVPELEQSICPTDSRLRPDQRAMENGDIHTGAKLKEQLEQKQRQTRKERERAVSDYEKAHKKKGNASSSEEATNTPDEPLYHIPRWFVRNIEQDTQLPQWAYKGGYWENRVNRNWGNVSSVFLSEN